MANKTAVSPIGSRLRELRIERHLTAEALAARVPDESLTKTVITNIESGRKRDLTATELIQVSAALGVNPLMLSGARDDPFSPLGIPGVPEPYGSMCVAEYLVANGVERAHGAISFGLQSAIHLFAQLRSVEYALQVHDIVESEEFVPKAGEELLVGDGPDAISLSSWDFDSERWHDRLYDLRMNMGSILREVRANRRLPVHGWLADRINAALERVERSANDAGLLDGTLPRLVADTGVGYFIIGGGEDADRFLLLDGRRGQDAQATDPA